MVKLIQKANKSLNPIKKESATLEAEKGEFALMPDVGGMPSSAMINGKPHSSGGTNLDMEDGSYIFSKFNLMAEHDENILRTFNQIPHNKKSVRKGFTPADIAKKYDITPDREILNDETSTDIDRKTAMYNMENKLKYMGKAALIQSSKNGFREGIPEVSKPYMQMIGITEDMLIPKENNQEQQQMQPQIEQAKFGKQIRRIHKYQSQGQVASGPKSTYTNQEIDDALNEYFKDITPWKGTNPYSKHLGSYGNELMMMKTFFDEHPEELEGLFNAWSNGNYAKSISENQRFKNKEDYLKYYLSWLASKQAWQTGNEGEKGTAYWDQVTNHKGQNGNYLQRRNTKEYADAFGEFAGIDNSYIPLFQSMDQAINEYAGTENGKKNLFSTRHVFDKADPNSNAGSFNTTTQDSGYYGSITDGFFGQRTAGFFPFIKVPEQTVEEPVEEATKIADKTKDYNHTKEYEYIPNDDWFIQDKNNLGLALNQRMTINEPRPWMPPLSAQTADPHLYDYRTYANDIASNAASIMNASGESADPSQSVAMASALNKSANDSIMKLQNEDQNKNVATLNQYEQYNNGIRNNFANANYNRLKKWYDETELGRQQLRNEKNKANAQIVNTFNNGIKNAAQRENLVYSTTNGRYYIDPYTNMVRHNRKHPSYFEPKAEPDPNANYIALAKQLMGEGFGLSAEKALEEASKIYGKDKSVAEKSTSELAQLAQLYSQMV